MYSNMEHGIFLPARAPIALLILGLVCAGLTVFLSPALFIQLGPMRQSLLSEIDFVRQVAHLEIQIARVIFGLTAIVSVLSWVFWKRWRSSAFVSRLSRHQPSEIYQDGPHRRAFEWIAGAILVSVAWIAASSQFPALMPFIVSKEDGIIEYLTAVLFLVAAFWSAYIGLNAAAKARRIVHVVLAIGFVLCFGEELSWGQRIFDFETPETIKAVNAQSEFNIHNSFGYAADHIFIAGIFFCGFVMPMLAQWSAFFRNLFDAVGLPIASPSLAWGFLLVSLLHNWTVYVVLPQTPLRIAELRELLSVLALLILMMEVKGAVRSAERAAAHTS